MCIKNFSNEIEGQAVHIPQEDNMDPNFIIQHGQAHIWPTGLGNDMGTSGNNLLFIL